MKIVELQSLFARCFRDAGVYQRSADGGALVEFDTIKKDNCDWLVVAAGVSPKEAANYFRGNLGRQKRATTAIELTGGGRLHVLFVVRPCDPAAERDAIAAQVAPFAPKDNLPFVVLRDQSYFRAAEIDDERLQHFRWELDARRASADPIEQWLRNWRAVLGYNPAHPPSHLHINALPFDPEVGYEPRADDSSGDLRLAVGVPNPLGLILSLATWLRQS